MDGGPRPLGVAAAAAVIGGMLVALAPQHATNIIRLVITTIATAAAYRALLANMPSAWWRSPFDRRVRENGGGPGEIGRMRSVLSARRQRIANSPALPPELVRRLQRVIMAALERQGGGRSDPDMAAAIGQISPLTRAVLYAKPLHRPPWRKLIPGNRRTAATVVHEVLDDLERTSGISP